MKKYLRTITNTKDIFSIKIVIQRLCLSKAYNKITLSLPSNRPLFVGSLLLCKIATSRVLLCQKDFFD